MSLAQKLDSKEFLAPVELNHAVAKFKNRDSFSELWKNMTGTFVEVGVWTGDFTSFVLDNSNFSTVYGVDPYKMCTSEEYPDAMNEVGQEKFDEIYSSVLERFANNKRHKFIRISSELAAKQFDDYSLDFVYIDGNHGYKQTLMDLKAWWPKIKKGGLLAGDDLLDDLSQPYDEHNNQKFNWSNDGKTWSSYGVNKALQTFEKEQNLSAVRLPKNQWIITRNATGTASTTSDLDNEPNLSTIPWTIAPPRKTDNDARMLMVIGAERGLYSDAVMDDFERIVLVEPNPDLVVFLREKYKLDQSKVVIVNKMVSDEKSVTMYMCDVDTLSTASKTWVVAGRFTCHNLKWTAVECSSVTLDELITTYGKPSKLFFKLQGYESHAIQSLTQHVGPICFQWAEEVINDTVKCIYHLLKLGYRNFAVQNGSEYTITPNRSNFLSADNLFKNLDLCNPAHQTFYGFIHCL